MNTTPDFRTFEHLPPRERMLVQRAVVRDLMKHAAAPPDRAYIVRRIIESSRRAPPAIKPADALAAADVWVDVLRALEVTGHWRRPAGNPWRVRRWPHELERVRCPWHEEHRDSGRVAWTARAAGPMQRNDFRGEFGCTDSACARRVWTDLVRWARQALDAERSAAWIVARAARTAREGGAR